MHAVGVHLYLFLSSLRITVRDADDHFPNPGRTIQPQEPAGPCSSDTASQFTPSGRRSPKLRGNLLRPAYERCVAHIAQRRTDVADGGLIISEATAVHPEAYGAERSPGIFNEQQISAWRNVTDAIHAKNGIVVCQLWALG